MLIREYELVIGIEPALQAMQIRYKDPRAFVERMAGMMQWMASPARDDAASAAVSLSTVISIAFTSYFWRWQ